MVITPAKRISIQLATTTAIALLIAFSVPTFVDRQDATTAFSQMLKNPSPESEAAFQREAAKNRREALVFDLVVAGSIFVVLNACWSLVYRWRKPANQGSS